MSDRTDIEVPPTGLLPEAPVEETAPDTPREKTPRELAMERIAANAEAERQKELAQHEVYTREAREAGLAYPDDEPVETTREPETQSVATTDPVPNPVVPAPPPAPPQTYEIDGLHLTLDQALWLARQGIVANRAIDQYQRGQFQQPTAPAPQAPPQPPALDQDQIAKTVKAIQYGDEATAGSALSELINHVTSRQPSAPQVDINAVIQQAANVARHQARLESDTQTIQREYADIFSNPIRVDAAARQVAFLRQENAALGKNPSELELYREAGNRVRAAFGLPQPGGQDDQQPGETGITAPQAPNIVVRRTAEVDARKRAAPRAMSQVIDRRSPAPQAPRAPTSSDVVEMMRKARGQTSMR